MSISIFNAKNNVKNNPPKAGFSFFNEISLPLRGKEREEGGDFCGFAAKKTVFYSVNLRNSRNLHSKDL